MPEQNLIRLALLTLFCCMPASFTATAAEAEKPAFTFAYMNDEKNIEAGRALWQQQCRHCHGASAYPGKAPKLKPRKYKPSFVFSRVTNGFRKMPPWKDVYTLEQRMALVAYVKSRHFSP